MNCSVTDHLSLGGAIYSKNSNLVLDHVCGTSCYSAYSHSFSLINGKEEGESIIYIHDSSIANCNASKHTMYLFHGHIQIKSLNSSNNNAQGSYSGVSCLPSSKDQRKIYGTCISSSSFTNNTAENDCLYLKYAGRPTEIPPSELNNSNIIENSCDQTIDMITDTQMNHCCIMQNKGSEVFYILKGCSCTLIDCSADENINSCNIKPSYKTLLSFKNDLAFISTHDCANIYGTFVSLEPSKRYSLATNGILQLLEYIFSFSFLPSNVNTWRYEIHFLMILIL